MKHLLTLIGLLVLSAVVSMLMLIGVATVVDGIIPG